MRLSLTSEEKMLMKARLRVLGTATTTAMAAKLARTAEEYVIIFGLIVVEEHIKIRAEINDEESYMDPHNYCTQRRKGVR